MRFCNFKNTRFNIKHRSGGIKVHSYLGHINDTSGTFNAVFAHQPNVLKNGVYPMHALALQFSYFSSEELFMSFPVFLALNNYYFPKEH